MSDHAVLATKSDIKRRASAFAARFSDAKSEKSEKQTFWNEFFAIFKIDRKQTAAFEELAKRSSTGSHGWIDLLYPGQMAVEHKSAGGDLDKAMGQVVDYVAGLSKAQSPWLLIACDFQRFRWHNLETGERDEFALADLPDNLALFWWLAGYQRPGEQFANDEELNLKATKLLAIVHDKVTDGDPSFAGHPLRVWLTRILFCLFADAAGVWDKAAFHAYVALRTNEDGSDLGQALAYLFELLNKPEAKRPKKLDQDLSQFIYVNGDLFAEPLPIPTCDAEIRETLLEACRFNWSAISPAIFGSMFQDVMESRERRQLGAHYTPERIILRTIRPLFLDELEDQLGRADSKPKLRAFLEKLRTLTFFDPACGCGNFLVVAYRELRRLETDALRRLRHKEGRTTQMTVDITIECRVRVDQFFGIEVEEFPARIARTAMYLVDHLCNRDVSREFGQHYVRFPIPVAPSISVGNAIEVSWHSLLPKKGVNFILGNPPYVGQKQRTAEQTADLRRIWGAGYARWLDYVTAWYRLAAQHIVGTQTRVAFVSTNSIAGGEQVARLWAPLHQEGIEIDFAHRAFRWSSEATGTAHVHCVIIGFSHHGYAKPKRLFHYADVDGEPTESKVDNINPYLIARENILIRARSTPLGAHMPPASYGNKPADGGNLVVSQDALPKNDSVAMRFIKKYMGTEELLDGRDRWCIWITDKDLATASKSAFIKKRVEAVRLFREASSAADTQKMASYPYRFFRIPQPQSKYIAIPRHVSEHRRWFTVDYLPVSVIASDALFTAPDPDGVLFGILSSSMFITWLRNIGGNLESRLRFSQLVYNSFVFPDASAQQLAKIRKAGEELLKARAGMAGMSLSQMYRPDFRPAAIIQAHAKLDRAVDAVFGSKKRTWTEMERLEILFDRYATAVQNTDTEEEIIEDNE